MSPSARNAGLFVPEYNEEMKSDSVLRRMLRLFLLPWSKIGVGDLNPILRSVFVGCASILAVSSIGWTLLSTSHDLNNRNVLAVLLNPDYRVVKKVANTTREVGICRRLSIRQPIGIGTSATEDVSHYGSPAGSYECRNWRRENTERSQCTPLYPQATTNLPNQQNRPKLGFGSCNFTSPPAESWWVATKYFVAGGPRYTTGRSRVDALERVVGVCANAIRSLLLPFGILLTIQFGLFTGYLYFRKISRTKAGDE